MYADPPSSSTDDANYYSMLNCCILHRDISPNKHLPISFPDKYKVQLVCVHTELVSDQVSGQFPEVNVAS